MVWYGMGTMGPSEPKCMLIIDKRVNYIQQAPGHTSIPPDNTQKLINNYHTYRLGSPLVQKEAGRGRVQDWQDVQLKQMEVAPSC